MSTRQVLFVKRYMHRVAERKAKEYISAYCQGMPVEEFRYAAENNLNVVGKLLSQFLLKPGEEKAGRKKAQPYRSFFEQMATVDNVVRLFDDVSPQHGAILAAHPQWLESQIHSARLQVFGT